MAQIDLTRYLDKKHEQKTIEEILELPVDALQGVSSKDAEALHAAFGIRTVRDLGRNKFFRIAQSLMEMAEVNKPPPPRA